MNNGEIENKIRFLHELMDTFIQFVDIEKEAITLSVSSLINIVIDVNEEIDKIRQFHHLASVSIAREMSLYCYYFLRRKPIAVMDETKEYAECINEKFCAFLLLSNTENIEIWDHEYIRFLISVFYRGELSKDAIYLLAMTMCQADKLGGKKDGV